MVTRAGTKTCYADKGGKQIRKKEEGKNKLFHKCASFGPTETIPAKTVSTAGYREINGLFQLPSLRLDLGIIQDNYRHLTGASLPS